MTLSPAEYKRTMMSYKILNTSSDIPGFHYDVATRRYYKIQPGHSGIASAVTNASITNEVREKKRQADVDLSHLSKYMLSPQTGCRSQDTNTVIAMLNQRTRGDVNSTMVHNFMLYNHVGKLRDIGHVKCDPHPGRTIDHMQQIIPSVDHKHVLAHWSFTTVMAQLLGLLRIHDIRLECLHKKLQPQSSHRKFYTPEYSCIASNLGKITNICWAPLPSEPQRNLILYTCLRNVGNTPSLAVIRDIGAGDYSENNRSSYVYKDFNLGRESIWSCCWNGERRLVGLGAESYGLILDIDTKKLWQMKTNKGGVYVQTFMTEHSHNCLLSGTKKGQIIQHDLRTSSTFPVMTLTQGSPISGMALVHGDDRVIASDFSGKIEMWDIRKRRIVQTYRGHVNEYTRIPIHLDESQRLLYTAGQDSYTRFWNVTTGQPVTHHFSTPYIVRTLFQLAKTATPVSGAPKRDNSYTPFLNPEHCAYTVSAGQDCYTRFWNVNTGQLLHSISQPCTVGWSEKPKAGQDCYTRFRIVNMGQLLHTVSPPRTYFVHTPYTVTAGQDCYTRFWNVNTGQLLHTIPPPCPSSRDAIPSIAYSQHWGGYPGNRGLLMGVLDNLYFYSDVVDVE